jgi:glycosyltransferase involved in cell wall biosynthesis
LVIDNGSTDQSKAIAMAYGVRVVSERTVGIAFARLRALKSARAPIVVFIDADSVPDRTWLTRLTQRFYSHQQLAVCYGKTVYPKSATLGAKVFNLCANFLRSIHLSAPIFAGGNNFAVRKNIFCHLHNFGIDLEVRWFDDAAFFYKVKQHRLCSEYVSDASIMTSPRRVERLGAVYYFFCGLRSFLQYWITGRFPEWVYQSEYSEIR